MSGMSLCPAFRHRFKSFKSLWHPFFRTIVLMELVLKNPCQQLCSFSLAPSYACPMSQGLETLAGLGPWAHSFSEQSCWWNLSWKIRANSSAFLVSLPANEAMHVPSPNVCKPTWEVLGAQFFGTIALMEFVLKTRANSSASQYVGALPKLFPTVSLPSTPSSFPYRSFPTELSPSLFPTVSLPSTLSSFPYRSFPPELSPCYFPRFPFRPPCRHSRIAPSSFQGFPSSSLHRSFRTELPPCYFPRFPLRPPNHRFRIAPSQRSSPRAISHGFPSVHPVVTPVSLLPTGALPRLFPGFPLVVSASQLPYGAPPMLFPTVSPPSTQSSLPYTLLPNGALPELFPNVSKLLPTVSLLSTSRRFRFAPSHRSSPHANFHGFPPVHPLVASASLLPTRALPMLISTVSAPSTLSSLPHRSFPPELSPSYFPRFPFRPPCRHSRIAPSHRSSPHANFHGSPPSTLSSLPHLSFPPELSPSYFPRFPPSTLSSLPYRSFPPELSPSYFPRFPPVHPLVASVSLLPHGALCMLFPTASPPSTLSSLPSCSFPTELSPSYFPRFPLRPPNRCFHPFPPNKTLPKLFPTVSPPSTQSLLPSVLSQQNSPQAISHGFPSVHPLVSLPRDKVTKREPKHRRCFWGKNASLPPWNSIISCSNGRSPLSNISLMWAPRLFMAAKPVRPMK